MSLSKSTPFIGVTPNWFNLKIFLNEYSIGIESVLTINNFYINAFIHVKIYRYLYSVYDCFAKPLKICTLINAIFYTRK